MSSRNAGIIYNLYVLMVYIANAVSGKHLSCCLLVTKEELKMRGPLAYRNLDYMNLLFYNIPHEFQLPDLILISCHYPCLGNLY